MPVNPQVAQEASKVVEQMVSKTALGKLFGATFLTTLITSVVFEHGTDVIKFLFKALTFPFTMFRKKKEENVSGKRLNGVEKRLDVIEGRIPELAAKLERLEKMAAYEGKPQQPGALKQVGTVQSVSKSSSGRAHLAV